MFVYDDLLTHVASATQMRIHIHKVPFVFETKKSEVLVEAVA
jgi:hypothetical protein